MRRNYGNNRYYAFAAALLLACVTAWAAETVNFNGEWKLTVVSSMGTTKPTLELTQNGNALTGTYRGRTGAVPLTGTVDGDKFKVTIKTTLQGQPQTMTYSGTVKGDTMSGVGQFLQSGGSRFTGTRSKPAS
jgi:hypothetical protein